MARPAGKRASRVETCSQEGTPRLDTARTAVGVGAGRDDAAAGRLGLALRWDRVARVGEIASRIGEGGAASGLEAKLGRDGARVKSARKAAGVIRAVLNEHRAS